MQHTFKFNALLFLGLVSFACASVPSPQTAFEAVILNADGSVNRTITAGSAPLTLAAVPGDLDLERRAGNEVVTCYNAGSEVTRATAVYYIDYFCNSVLGASLSSGQIVQTRYFPPTGKNILLSGQAINGCSWTIDNNCFRLLRRPLDECNTSGTEHKQGGYVTDACGQWRFDPGSNGNDY